MPATWNNFLELVGQFYEISWLKGVINMLYPPPEKVWLCLIFPHSSLPLSGDTNKQGTLGYWTVSATLRLSYYRGHILAGDIVTTLLHYNGTGDTN